MVNMLLVLGHGNQNANLLLNVESLPVNLTLKLVE